MEDTALDTILVVSEREFLVNRKLLIENSSYFRAMFEGGFKESSADRIELKSIPVSDADAFAVLIKCIQNNQVTLKELVGILLPVLGMCDILSLDEFVQLLKHELFISWSELETVESILVFAEALHLRPALWTHILSSLRNAFQKMSSDSSEDFDVSILDESPDLIADILGTEESSTLCFWDIESDESFVRGVISWVLSHQFPQSSIRKLVRCFGALYRNQNQLIKIINKEEKTHGRYTVKPEVHNFIRDTEDYFRSSTYRLCGGSFGSNEIKMCLFILRNWNRPALHSCVQKSTTEDSKVDTYYYYVAPSPLGYCLGNTEAGEAELPSRRSPMYTSAQKTISEINHLLIFELEHGEKLFSEIFRGEIPGPILGCELIRVEFNLHGFLTYEVEGLYNVCHFVLHRNREGKKWNNTNFRLDPLLSNIRQEYIPEATAASTGGDIVVFLQCRLILFLTEYNIENGFLKPLAHRELPCYRLLTTYEEGQYNGKHKKICTINLACCSYYKHPIYNLFFAPGKERDCFTFCFLHEFGDCAKNENHVPKLKSIIHICETL